MNQISSEDPEPSQINDEIIPTIQIGKGSSKFYSNLVRSFLNNHDTILIVAGGYRINLAIWVVYMLSNDFVVSPCTVNVCSDGYLKLKTSVGFYISIHGDKTPISLFEEDPNKYYIKVSRKSKTKTLLDIACKREESIIIAAGSSCSTAYFLMTQAWMNGLVPYNVEIIKTTDNDGIEKAGIKYTLYNTYDCYVDYGPQQLPQGV